MPNTNITDTRAFLEALIAKTKEPDRADKLRLAMEFLTNPAFRRAVEDTVWEINQGRFSPPRKVI